MTHFRSTSCPASCPRPVAADETVSVQHGGDMVSVPLRRMCALLREYQLRCEPPVEVAGMLATIGIMQRLAGHLFARCEGCTDTVPATAADSLGQLQHLRLALMRNEVPSREALAHALDSLLVQLVLCEGRGAFEDFARPPGPGNEALP